MIRSFLSFLTLTILSGLGLLYVLKKSFSDRVFRNSLQDRFFFSPPSKSSLWIHAASLGELDGVRPFSDYIHSVKTLITTTSVSGQKKAAELFPNAEVKILPYDISFLMKRWIRHASPDMIWIFETEIWPTLLRELSKCNYQVFWINARMTDKTFPFYKILSQIIPELFTCISVCIPQCEEDKRKFLSLGISHIPFLGSTKFDQPIPEKDPSPLPWIEKNLPTILFASSRPNEEKRILTVWKKLQLPCNLVLVPRHIERSEEIEQLLTSEDIQFSRFSDNHWHRCVLVSQFGVLNRLYSHSDIVLIGGTFEPFGGHSLIDPVRFSLPIILGQSYNHQIPAVEILKRSHGCLILSSDEELTNQLTRLLTDEELRKKLGTENFQAWLSSKGVADKLISKYFKSNA